MSAAILLQLAAAAIAFGQGSIAPPPPSQREPQIAPVPGYNPNPESTPIQVLPSWLWPPGPGRQPPVATAPTQPSSPLPHGPSIQLTEPALQENPVLPPVFRGCWKGEVTELDWIKRLPGAHKVGYWTPKTYRVCYRRLGSGPFRLTLTETSVEENEKIIHPVGRVMPISTDGRAYARMHATLHFDEYSIDRDSPSATFAVDESTYLDCRISNNKMLVTADVYGKRDNAPWFRARWHADFGQVRG